MQITDDFPKQAADAVGVTPYSDMRPFVEQAVKWAIAALAAQGPQPVGVPDGWQLAPKGPTSEMMEAGVSKRNARDLFNLNDAYHVYRVMLAAAPQPPAIDDGWQPTHRHKKRGSTYTVLAEGRLQVDGDLDNERVVIYRGEDGHVWARPKYEFEDGRFEALPPAPANGGEHDR